VEATRVQINWLFRRPNCIYMFTKWFSFNRFELSDESWSLQYPKVGWVFRESLSNCY